MAQEQLMIDKATVFDNANDRRVEFAGEVDGIVQAFAVQYDVLEAIAAEVPDDRAVALFHQHADRIAAAGASALARDGDQEIVVISENDLD